MVTEPKRSEPDIPPQKPDIQPESSPEEIPQDKNFPEKESPPMVGHHSPVGGFAPGHDLWHCEMHSITFFVLQMKQRKIAISLAIVGAIASFCVSHL
jgi:hypothetical protein